MIDQMTRAQVQAARFEHADGRVEQVGVPDFYEVLAFMRRYARFEPTRSS